MCFSLFLPSDLGIGPGSDATVSKKASNSKSRKHRVFGQGEATIRAGLYARVSTHDQQTLSMQLSAMREYVKKRGWVVALEMKDIGSGASLRQKREELLAAARRAKSIRSLCGG